ncbi:30S ribosomal protein S9 [Patescibacteria group bacterium]
MKKEEVKIEEKKVKSGKKADEKYFYAVGRRKSSTAQVRIYETEKAGDSDLIVNGKKLREYFPLAAMQSNFLAPLRETGMHGKFKVSVLVKGGGITGQVEASRLGIARALVKFDENLKPILKSNGFMTRDAREVERKKPGLKKARRAPQWAKR